MRPTVLLFSLLPFLLAATARAQSWELGPRLLVLNAGGEPANDLMGAGVFGRYRVNDRWLVGFAVDSITGDYERPYEFVGISSPEEIDATIDAVVFSGWIEREYGRPDGRLGWFWTAGLGFTSPGTDDVTGPRTGGGTFDVTTDAGSEILASIGFGLRHRLGQRWGLSYSVRADQHFADWEITDRVSGQTGAIDDYTTYGLLLGLTYRF